MPEKQVVFSAKKMSAPHNTQVPVHVLYKGNYVKVGDGIFDAKNHVITTTVNSDTPEGALFLEGINTRVLTRAVNTGENID